MTLQRLHALRQRLYDDLRRHCFEPLDRWETRNDLSFRALRMLRLVENQQYLKCRNRLP